MKDLDWEVKFPMASVQVLERIEALSDHAPILLTTGSQNIHRKHQFKFELGWLNREGFDDMVKMVWARPVNGATPLDRCNNKIRALRKHLRGWARHLAGLLKKEKNRMSSIIDELESLAEWRPLSTHEIELKKQSNAEMAAILRDEELKWYQRSKAQFILEGDSNTRYFHSLANSRHRKKLIHSLDQDEGKIEGHGQLKEYITRYYKNLFGEPDESDFSRDESWIEDIPQVFVEENA